MAVGGRSVGVGLGQAVVVKVALGLVVALGGIGVFCASGSFALNGNEAHPTNPNPMDKIRKKNTVPPRNRVPEYRFILQDNFRLLLLSRPHCIEGCDAHLNHIQVGFTRRQTLQH